MDSTQNKRIPQVSHLLIPEPIVRDRVDRSILRLDKDRETQMKLVTASNAVHNSGIYDYFSLQGLVSTQYGEDYVELYQVYGQDNKWAPMWGTRLYRSGAVTRRSVVVSYPIDGNMWLTWFEKELRATMVFAAEIFATYEIVVDQLRVVSVLRGAEDVLLKAPGMFGMPVAHAPKAMEHFTMLPSRERMTIRAVDLRDDPQRVATEMARLLRLRYSETGLG
jgi:hypothetical protein